ncbi:MAG TPA: acetylglutamate kinase [Clostridium sp.]|uniref:Acetylglutamate kinase n=1 Tax=Clostridium lapidicellarium TaxID=3240931 RepID=A0ABV4DXD3_9CLOT|nr:acetylglutamate kinase [uncultured Clostridium sp.]NLU08716.1 acetylglutamate kinase [Clostridiales bacterium]HBC96920.1 acetylglutamate kinase [Clostridium sp.]
MNYDDVAVVLAESLPYIQKYRGKTIVIKYGGSVMKDERLKRYVINDLVLMKCIGINIVLVHGGGPFISSHLKKLNKKSIFVDGLRYTDDETMDVVQMVLCGKVNKDLVNLIEDYGGKSIGLCGIDGNMIEARKASFKVDLGNVGEIVRVNPEVINDSIDDGYIPVISSVARGIKGELYNINADTCTFRIAVSLKAQNLILLTDVPGIMTDTQDSSTLISEIKLEDIPKMYRDNIIKGGMIPKINSCAEAIKSGVKSAHIIDGRVPHCLLLELFSKKGIGTMIY